jgi:hypothetical protein
MSNNILQFIDTDLTRNENGSYSSNHYGFFPDWSTVNRVFSGKWEQIAYKEGPTRNSTLYRNAETGQFFEVYLAQGCGDAYNLPVENPVGWLVNVGDEEPAHIELVSSNKTFCLTAFNLPAALVVAVTEKAREARLLPAEWIRRRLEEATQTTSDGDAAL